MLSLKVKCTNKSSHSVNVCEWIGELNYLQVTPNDIRCIKYIYTFALSMLESS